MMQRTELQRTERSYLGEKGEGRGRVEIHGGRGQKTLKAHSLNPRRTHGRRQAAVPFRWGGQREGIWEAWGRREGRCF